MRHENQTKRDTKKYCISLFLFILNFELEKNQIETIFNFCRKRKKFDPIQIKSIQKSFQNRILSMAASYLPSILVPLVGLVFPAVAMASLFLYIEKEEIV
jgi:photosystem I subunit VIII